MKSKLMSIVGLVAATQGMAASRTLVTCHAEGLTLTVEAEPDEGYLSFAIDVDRVGSYQATIDPMTAAEPGYVSLRTSPDWSGGQILSLSGNTNVKKWVEPHRECHRRLDGCEDVPGHFAALPDQWIDIQLHKWPGFTFFTLANLESWKFGIPSNLKIVNPTACQISGM